MMQQRADLRKQEASTSGKTQTLLATALFGALRERLAGNAEIRKAIDAALGDGSVDQRKAVSVLRERIDADPKIGEALDAVLAEWLASEQPGGAQHVPRSALLALREQLLGTVRSFDGSLQGKGDDEEEEEATTSAPTTKKPVNC